MSLDPKLYHIGIHPETAAILAAHSSGKDLLVQTSADHHGGLVLSVTPDEYARIVGFVTDEVVPYRHPVDGQVHKSAIEAAVRKAFA